MRCCTSDQAYFQWQREVLSQADIAEVNRLIEARRAPDADAEDVAFYNFTAQAHALPVFYSERHDYYLALGAAVAEHLAGARAVLDFGCGPGILTTFYARRFPGCSFLGLDRSQISIEVASRHASALGLSNVRFQCIDLCKTSFTGLYDTIIASQALLQTEGAPGLPSLSWRTFERGSDAELASAFEERTGLALRLDRLCRALAQGGRLVLFEKTTHLARRVPFQRSLAARGFSLLEAPRVLRYRLVEEVVDDGPLYVLTRVAGAEPVTSAVPWVEVPDVTPADELYRCLGEGAQLIRERLPDRIMSQEALWTDPSLGEVRMEWGRAAKVLTYVFASAGTRFQGIVVGGLRAEPLLQTWFTEARGMDCLPFEKLIAFFGEGRSGQEDPRLFPLYENHTCAAQAVWESLPQARVQEELTDRAARGRELHIELGTSAGLVYLYCANTFDQRQLVLVEPERRSLLDDHFRELVEAHKQEPR